MKSLFRRLLCLDRSEPDEHDLTQYDRANARVEIRSSMGRLHLFVNGFVVATEGDTCRDGDLAEMSFGAGWTKERLIEAATGRAS